MLVVFVCVVDGHVMAACTKRAARSDPELDGYTHADRQGVPVIQPTSGGGGEGTRRRLDARRYFSPTPGSTSRGMVVVGVRK